MRVLKLSVAFIGIAMLVFITPAVKAATPPVDNSFNLVTSPLPINLIGKPGTVVSTDIRVKNGSAKTEKLKVTLMKFSAYGEEGKPAIAEREPGDTYFDWVSFTPQTFDAPQNEWITIKMTINIPTSAAFGYYYAAVFSRASAPERSSSKENILVGSTAVLALLDVQVPGANRTAKIASFTSDRRFYEFLPAKFSIKIRNSGNVHLIPTGNVFISRGSKQLASLTINSAAGNILPNSNRIFTTSWDDGFPVYKQKEANGQVVLNKKDKPVSGLEWDFSKLSHLKFGRYTAHLVMAYDNGSRDVPIEATVSFWVIPVRAILLAIAIPLVPSLLVYLLMKRRLKKQLNPNKFTVRKS